MYETKVENRRWIRIAALFGASAVAFGAFGSHGLRHRVTPELLATWRVAVEYHLFHTLALLVVAMGPVDSRKCRWPLWLWCAGIVLFSGSLYAMVLSGLRGLGAVTPVGGVCFIAGWLLLVWIPRQRQ